MIKIIKKEDSSRFHLFLTLFFHILQKMFFEIISYPTIVLFFVKIQSQVRFINDKSRYLHFNRIYILILE